MEKVRKIIHVDMDAFYASVEQRDFPEYRGKPVIVGGRPDGRGVVAAASYEARKFGIRSAMPSRTAYKLCPQAVFLPARFDAYREVSSQIMEIFRRYTELVEPLSLDEAFLDVTENKLQIPFARDIAKRIKAEIFEETGLRASAGVAPNKFLAKIASDFHKPNGLTIIPPEKIETFLADLPVRKFPGVGPVTEQKMATMGIFTNSQLQKFTLAELQAAFGKSGDWYYRISRGIDERAVESEWERKSLGAEDTFEEDLEDPVALFAELLAISKRVAERLLKRELKGRTLTLKVTFSGFHKITRSRTAESLFYLQEDLYRVGCELLSETDAGPDHPVRLLGLQVSNFAGNEPLKEERQPTFPLQMKFVFGQTR